MHVTKSAIAKSTMITRPAMSRRNQSYQISLSPLCSFGLILLIVSGLSFVPLSLSAQDSSPAKTTASEITIDEINHVARELWCPLCSGVRLDTCELTACDDMREQIGLQLADGASVEEIKTYFIEQYGPQVLGEPPLSGFNWLAWVVPGLALLAGAFLILLRGRYMFASTAIVDEGHMEENFGHRTSLDDDFESDGSSKSVLPSDTSSNKDIDMSEDNGDETISQRDRYVDALDKELEAYE